MNVQQSEPFGKKTTALDAAYLSEINERISRLRLLHEKMERQQEPWDWLKSLTEQMK